MDFEEVAVCAVEGKTENESKELHANVRQTLFFQCELGIVGFFSFRRSTGSGIVCDVDDFIRLIVSIRERIV